MNNRNHRARGKRPQRVHGKALALILTMVWNTASAAPALWLVQSPTAKVYLFGTMHILPKKADWFSGNIEAAFDASSQLIEEADVGLTNPAALQGIMAQAIAPDYDVWSKLSEKDAAKFRTEVQKCGLPDQVVAHFRPWFASMLPSICALMSGADGALQLGSASPEAALLQKARAAGKTLDFFETPDQQIRLLSGASDAVQIKELESAIEDGDNNSTAFNGMEASWLAGDVPAIAKLIDDTRSKGADFYDLIFTQRNARFAARVAALLRGDKTVFVAIGAGHLAGPDSVQAQLAKLSINAKRL